ncbi:MAG: hypothetical protein ABI306_02775, partial [Caulobacteraceae bacterium]
TAIELTGAGYLFTRSGLIQGGRGGLGNPGDVSGAGGAGGIGADVTARGTVNNDGAIVGGSGYLGEAGQGQGFGGAGGSGGAGVELRAGGSLINNSGIFGGAGGAGGYGYYSGGNGGSGGDGVTIGVGGKVLNVGTIEGGASAGPGGYNPRYGLGGRGGFGGNGVSILHDGSVTNGEASIRSDLIEGGGGYGYGAGVYAGPGSRATVTNFGTIEANVNAGAAGYAVYFASARDKLVVESASTFIGEVHGGGGTLDLASGKGSFFTGLAAFSYVTVSGSMPTTRFDDFDTVEIGNGANFTQTGAGDVAAGQSLVVNGTLSINNLNVAGSLTVNHTLRGAKFNVGTLAVAGGTATFDVGAQLTAPIVNQSGASAVNVNTILSFAGQWNQSAGTLNVGGGDTLTFTAQGIESTFAGTLNGPGQVSFMQDTAIMNGATVNLGVQLSTATLFVGTPGLTLGGGGTLTLDAAGTSKIADVTTASTLTNGGYIYGAGSIGGGQMSLVNQAGGTIDANAAMALMIDTGGSTIANAGLIEATGAGGLAIQSALANTGTIGADGGTVTVNGAVTGSGMALIDGGTLDFTGAFNEAVSFEGTSGVLELARSRSYKGNITGFSKTGGTSLDLADIGFKSAGQATYSGTASGGTLTVTDGTHTAHIALNGDYTTSTFAASSDGHGGTTVVDNTAAAAMVSPHQFIAAMAGMPSGGAGALQPHADSWRLDVHALAAPGRSGSICRQ